MNEDLLSDEKIKLFEKSIDNDLYHRVLNAFICSVLFYLMLLLAVFVFPNLVDLINHFFEKFPNYPDA